MTENYWEAVCAKARRLGWEYGRARYPNLTTWYKSVDGVQHILGEYLWYAEIENGRDLPPQKRHWP